LRSLPTAGWIAFPPVDGPGELKCVRHLKPTRITCVTCDTPICPDCAIRTEVGFKCPDHASKPPAPRRSRWGSLAIPLVIVAVLAFAQLARTTGRGEPSKPRCPTETAPDVGIGSEGGTHWREMAPSGLCGRYHTATVWTGTELLIWGGENCAGSACPSIEAPHLSDGAAYTPATDKWRKLPAAPISARTPAATAWTGTEMLVWGGVSENGFFADGAAYDPAANRWRPMAASPLAARNAGVAAWSGRELLVWSGGNVDTGFRDGAAYDPAADRWRPLSASPLAPRAGAAGVWTGREMLVWSGVDPAAGVEFRDGAAYDPAADRWRPIASSPIAGRDDAAAVWSGRELLVWGGTTLTGPFFADGAAYDPATDRWRVLEPVPLLGRGNPITVWDGQGMLMWGGLVVVSTGASSSEGVRYTP
jgi:N-acetylneuraminic acid mutarotase